MIRSTDARSRLARLLDVSGARLLALVALIAYFAIVAALGGHQQGWRRVGVPVETYRFADLRNLTSSWECTRRGIPVLPTNPCDLGHRPADFPQIWLLASRLGLGPGDTYALGIAQGALFLIAALLVLGRGESLKTGALYALVLCSPAVMLGVERENPDLILFPIVLAAVLAATRSARGEIVAGALVLFAAILKLYPILALGFLVRRATRAALLAASLAVVVFAAYCLATLGYLHRMLGAIPPSDHFSYGVRRASEWFAIATSPALHALGSFRGWDVALVSAAAAAGWLLSRSRRGLGSGSPDRAASRDLDLFWVGACIYVGSYPIFRSNDYRLIFCLLTVPQLARWARQRDWLAAVTILALLVITWLDEWTEMPGVRIVLDWWNRTTLTDHGTFPLPIVVIAQWVVCTTFIAWLLATAPSVLESRRRRAGKVSGSAHVTTVG